MASHVENRDRIRVGALLLQFWVGQPGDGGEMLRRAACSGRWRTVWRTLVVGLMLAPRFGTANDGLYQGAGSHLVPVKNAALRVVRETLVIRPVEPATCANVMILGKPAKWTPDAGVKLPEPVKESDISLGPPHACDRQPDVWSQLVARWRAEATYSIEVTTSVPEVLIGFPVPTWTFTYNTPNRRGDVELPGVTRFETFVDGKRLGYLETRILEVTGHQTAKTLGYVWSASFQAGSRHALRTTYEFGQDYSNDFYAGREYRGEPPWFLREGRRRPGATSIHYYLTPIRTWADPPPEEILVRVELPKDLPVTAFVPVWSRPNCVDEHALHYRWDNAFPESDLTISFPDSPLPRFQTTEQWTAWRESLGGDAVKITCRLRGSLAAAAGKALKKVLTTTPCVPQCVPGSL